MITSSEMVAADGGIVFLFWNSWRVVPVDIMYVGLRVIAGLCLIFSVILGEIEGRLIPWKSSA